MEELMIKIENVSKQYKLGQIGGTTLREELQRQYAKLRGKEDPTKKIGARDYQPGETFMALNGVSFDVKKGERVGIIGHNGAGKSTLLKLISRVTAPSSGRIRLNGRVASMLEVGTGFHGELTGRENIYMNGAILGMTKKEIDAKMEDIIEFSECRQFIDTPVKRYSSGMYVKLAFSVAAHLDSEIMIMDEVLAVGDMAFQKKCLDKMSDVSRAEGRTILYVSHNMNTIRQLCDRCVVLDHGRVCFDGDVETSIGVYGGLHSISEPLVDLSKFRRETDYVDTAVKMVRLEIETNESCFPVGSLVKGKLIINSKKQLCNCDLVAILKSNDVAIISFCGTQYFDVEARQENVIEFSLDLGQLAPAKYNLKLILGRWNKTGGAEYLDIVTDCYAFDVIETEGFNHNQKWNVNYRGHLLGPKMVVRSAKINDDSQLI